MLATIIFKDVSQTVHIRGLMADVHIRGFMAAKKMIVIPPIIIIIIIIPGCGEKKIPLYNLDGFA